MKKLWIALISLLVGLSATWFPVHADGIIIPPPCIPERCPPDLPRPISQLVVRYHRVEVTIDRQIAVTRVDQVFFNPNSYPIEGTYLFPLPRDAVVSQFKLWVDGQPVEGKVLSAEEARKTYDDIVLSLRDPALLEYAGQGAVKASIFPIPAHGERRIQLEYSQVLTAENGLVRYAYPLSTEKFSTRPLEEVSLRVTIRSEQPIRVLYSPSHPVDVTRTGDRQALVGWEATNVLPEDDFVLYFSTGEDEAFHLFSYRDPEDPQDADGYFLLLMAARPGSTHRIVPKDVIFVIDRSGSMEGEKFRQAQEALRYVIRKLNPEDRFHLLAFSTGVEIFREGMRTVEEAADAIAWIDGLSAAGSTDINRALLEALSQADRERPVYLIFLTDGLPTVGELDTQQILENVARVAPGNVRLFTFGVGYDVDTVLLDSLSGEHHGLSTYVKPGESLGEAVSAFYERIGTPVMTDLSLHFEGVGVYDVYPQPLPDLFAGTQILVVGRYRQGGKATVTVRGMINGEIAQLTYSDQNLVQDSTGVKDSSGEIPRLWATRKIGYLLNQIRLKGADQESIDQIVRLSIRFGIVTPYTSYLVTEPMPLGAESQNQIAAEALQAAQSTVVPPSGEGAVQRAASEGALKSAEVAPEVGNEDQAMIRIVGARTFLFRDGIWVDTAYDPESMTLEAIPFLSDRYFELAHSYPEAGPALALGERVLVVIGGKAYRVEQMADKPGAVTTVSPSVTPSAGQEGVSPGYTPTKSSPEQTGKNTFALCSTIMLPLILVAGFWFYRRWMR
ncbi:uncharacterized protein containing a von Willebrand factor type A (vWA) domain [Anaerolinea thermolimosa]|uniref:VIT domain-containing protein n=1 Tax=Anaerolinea thermolimosa TaxID=229919 RepID=UPI0007817E14|nr:VIT domain-containing protein [Anaerolinea thermolimosa]GAP06825.1 uncharacterized protein containing a von Willebrand factor type A (vWA) domain [Anaerolinea thermolimosa]